jgi:hypothetical protein
LVFLYEDAFFCLFLGFSSVCLFLYCYWLLLIAYGVVRRQGFAGLRVDEVAAWVTVKAVSLHVEKVHLCQLFCVEGDALGV